MKFKNLFVKTFLVLTMLFSGCFSPYEGGQSALTISIGAGQARASWGNYETNNLLHIVTVTGQGQSREERFMGEKTVSFILNHGVYNVEVRAYKITWENADINNLNIEDLIQVAEGSAAVEVKSGLNAAAVLMRLTSEREIIDDFIFTDIAAFKTWLDAQPNNTVETAYNVKLNISDLSGSSETPGSAGNALYANTNKYVNLDLSGSTFTALFSSQNTPSNFTNCSNLTEIILPNTVTGIGDTAFKGCSSLTNITIPNSVKNIGGSSFQDCTSLTSITIPGSVTTVWYNAFAGCTSLTSVTFGTGSNIPGETFGENAFPEGANGAGGQTLRNAYFNATNTTSGGAGTYTRQANGDAWTKQP